MKYLIKINFSLLIFILLFQNCGGKFSSNSFDKVSQSNAELGSGTQPNDLTEAPTHQPPLSQIDPKQDGQTPSSSNIPSYAKYKGVNNEMWDKISEIGDPLNCRDKINNLERSADGTIITACNGDCINQALANSNIVTLKGGEYRISQTIKINSGQILKGANGERVIINATGLENGMEINGGTSSNLEIQYAENLGVVLKRDTLVYRVIVGNTGVSNRVNRVGAGFYLVGNNTTRNCLVSIEAYNGYNEGGYGCEFCNDGGNADGISVKAGANNVTFIDAHVYNNSDDGFDFWEGGAETGNPNIRIFYGSANENGKHPTRQSQDGNGIKFGSNKIDRGTRLAYGTATCNNKSSGFDRNNSKAIIQLFNCTSNGNKNNYAGTNCIQGEPDSNAVTCN